MSIQPRRRRRASKESSGVLTKILASAGTLLVWLPLLAPLGFSLGPLLRAGRLRLDYLMPAELFPLVLVGGGLLLWAAVRRRKFRALIGWGLGAAALLLTLVDVLALLSGLASGQTQPGGWQSVLVLAALVGYNLALVLSGVGGLLLTRAVFREA